MKYLSVCSGIEAATVAWHPLGWRPVGFSEIEPFPSAVLAHHYPDVPNHGDFTTLLRNPPAGVDVLVGGTPCQAFSVAGLRGGLSDPRGNLALAFVALVGVLRPRWVVWENVPGVLSSGGGRDFGSFLGGLGELGYGWAYRVLDAQYFGLAQRRQRVFVVASPGDWRRAAAVLFEPEGVRRDSPPRREARSGVAGAVGTGASSGGGWRVGADEAAAGQVVPTGDGEVDGYQVLMQNNGDGGNRQVLGLDEPTPTLNLRDPPAILTKMQTPATFSGQGVRRLMPHELERLQGFPDDYTRIPYRGKPAEDCPDGPRAKALGNSMAVPVMRWIGERIAIVDALPQTAQHSR